MWFYRRLMRISWKDKMTNKEVLRKVGLEQTCLMNAIRKRQLEFLRHIIRRDGIEKSALAGKIEGKRQRGRQRTTYLQSIKNCCSNGEMDTTKLIRSADDRKKWKSMIADVCNRYGI